MVEGIRVKAMWASNRLVMVAYLTWFATELVNHKCFRCFSGSHKNPRRQMLEGSHLHGLPLRGACTEWLLITVLGSLFSRGLPQNCNHWERLYYLTGQWSTYQLAKERFLFLLKTAAARNYTDESGETPPKQKVVGCETKTICWKPECAINNFNHHVLCSSPQATPKSLTLTVDIVICQTFMDEYWLDLR